MREKLQRFMIGRYGFDDLGRFLNILALIILVAGTFLIPQITVFALVLIVICYFRMFSRNMYKRANENMIYLGIRGKITGFFSSIFIRMKSLKTHCYFRCPSCRQKLRVPRGKGKISISCPKCHTKFERRS